MQFDSTRFGHVPIDPDTVITFPHGMAGFEHCTRYKLLHEKGKPRVQWLQSLDDPDVSFSLVDPADFNIFYEMTLTDEEEALLDVTDQEELALLVMVQKLEGTGPSDGLGAHTYLPTNIAAQVRQPLVLNTRTRNGLQKVLLSAEQSTTIRER